MQHLSDDALASLALGEPGRRHPHVDRCDECASEVAALRATADRLRAAYIQPVEPPAALWDRILAEIQAEPRAAPPSDAAAT